MLSLHLTESYTIPLDFPIDQLDLNRLWWLVDELKEKLDDFAIITLFAKRRPTNISWTILESSLLLQE